MNTNNTQLVQISGDRPVTTSLAVSNNFGKKHKDVLRAIQNLECSKEFTERNGQAQSRLPFRPPRYGAPAALHRNGTESGGSRQTLGHCAVQRARAPQTTRRSGSDRIPPRPEIPQPPRPGGGTRPTVFGIGGLSHE